MIQLNTAKFARAIHWLEWQKAYNGIFIRFPENQLSLHTLFYVHSNLTFKHIANGMNLPQAALVYPQGVNAQSNIMEFLQDETKAKSVEITLRDGQKKYLRNKACDHDIQIIRSNIKNSNSIYSHMAKYIGPVKQDETVDISSKINYFLNQFYMRLSAQTYCKMKGIKPNTVVDDGLKNQIFNFIGQQYENHSPAAIRKVYMQRDIILGKIAQTKRQIQVIEDEGDRRIKVYKIGAILMTITHIVSFGYMIFFVDWLGWDIIEPLTYSVGVAYTLLGIRFYRKYRTDRTGDSIRQTLLKIIMKPQKIIQLKDLKFRLELQEAELRRIEVRARLLKNRINFKSSLADAYTRSVGRNV